MSGRIDDVGAPVTRFGMHPGSDDGPEQAVGIAAGTHVQTRRGEVAAEALLPGEEVLTASGSFARIRSVVTTPRDAASRLSARQVRIRRDAFGTACPFEDVLLAPSQRISIGATTIAATAAIDGRMILREPAGGDRLVTIELDAPALLLAGGLAVASA